MSSREAGAPSPRGRPGLDPRLDGHTGKARGRVIVLLAFLLGFVVAAVPLGPLTLMYYRYAVVEDWRSAGLLGGVGALADGVYTWLAMHGYAWLAGMHPTVLIGVRAVGVLLIGGLGFRYAI